MAVVEHLHRLQSDLESFQTILGTQEDPVDVTNSWQRCENYNRFLEELMDQPLPDDQAQREQLRSILERIIRLNAIIAASMQRQRDEIVLQLEKARAAIDKLQCFRPMDLGGDSCDLEG